jgi:cell division initiation protein
LRISPLDVRSQEFKKGLRGYDPEEVKAFLDAIADTMEDLLKEKETAQAELVGLKKKVETFTEMELSLRDAMVAAQKAADEAKMNARRNAELMIREAELEVRQRIADAKRQVDDVFKARETVRAEMRAFLPRLRSLLESQLTYLENIEQEVMSMDLGNGDVEEAKEVRTFTETVESKAQEAAGQVRDETVRQEEHAVERREEIAREPAVEGEQQPEHQEHAELDAAMHEHHEKQAQPEQETAPKTAATDSPWRPASPEGEPESDKELRVSHTPQEGETERPEDVNA